MLPSSLEQYTAPAQGGLSALDRLKLKLPQTKKPPIEVSPTAATSEDLAMLEGTMSLESTDHTIEENISLDEVTAFEPPAFVPQPAPEQPIISSFSDIQPLTPAQPTTSEIIIQPKPVNTFAQNQPEILPTRPTVTEQPITPRVEIVTPVIPNTPKLPTPVTKPEIAPPSSPQAKTIGFINKYLPFTRKDQNKVNEPVLSSGKNGTVNSSSQLEAHYIGQLKAKDGDR